MNKGKQESQVYNRDTYSSYFKSCEYYLIRMILCFHGQFSYSMQRFYLNWCHLLMRNLHVQCIHYTVLRFCYPAL